MPEVLVSAGGGVGLFGASGVAVGETDITETTAGFQDIPGMSVTLTGVKINSQIVISGEIPFAQDTAGLGILRLLRDGSEIARVKMAAVDTVTTRGWDAPIRWVDDNPGAGSHTYKLQWNINGITTLYQNGTTYKRRLSCLELLLQ